MEVIFLSKFCPGEVYSLVTVDAKVQLCIGCELQRKEIYVVEFSHSALETKRLI